MLCAAAERAARRAARKQRADQKGGKGDEEENGMTVPLSEQDQVFMEEKRQTDEKIVS